MLGRHFLIDYSECDPKVLDDLDAIQLHLKKAAELSNATLIQILLHRFAPQGVTGIAVIAESHIAIHTWPELGRAAVDIFSCGTKMNPSIAIDYLKKAFNAKTIHLSEVAR